ncbi:hypothetical protein [uncultured Nostoc sp.]|uniref:hypothetical protein n=1 Tax=uncultured Nostoc sp. TaxID=340711 RepID=UPI002634E6B3|nr:hypothetical protein [uncultured Nostoc sp.]
MTIILQRLGLALTKMQGFGELPGAIACLRQKNACRLCKQNGAIALLKAFHALIVAPEIDSARIAIC